MTDALLDSAPCGYLAFADDGTVLRANATLLGLLGCEREDIEGRHIESLLSVGSRIFYQTHVFPLVRMHGSIQEVYLALRRTDGTEVPVLLNANRTERDGVFVNACAMLPIHKRQEFEDALLSARSVAEASAASKARFLSILAHEIRTPLNGMLGYVQLLEEGIYGGLNHDQKAQLERVRAAGAFLLSLLENVLHLSRLEAKQAEFNFEVVQIGQVLESAEDLVMHSLQEAGLTFARDDCPESVCADPDRLQQVLLNLLTNAIKYTKRGGHVSVRCERSGERVHIHVADTGRGIPADQIGRIFEPFVQLEGRSARGSSGVGLGLGISRELVRGMRGDLTVRSTEGEGSVFTVTLPVA